MLRKRRRSGQHGWPAAIFLLLAVVSIAALVSCSSGVPEEDFNAVVKDLETEKAFTESLESELATDKASSVRLVEAIDRLEARIAELESKLAKETAAIAERQDKVDEAEAEAALLAAFLAWNRKDREEFEAHFSDAGISETLLSVPASLGEPAIALRRVMDAAVIDDTATIHAMFALGTQRHSVRYSMAKQDGVWKIGGEERLSPKVHGDAPVVDLKLDGCSPLSESEIMIDQNVAFRVENSGQEHPHLVLKMVAEDFDSGLLLQGDVAPAEGVSDVAFVREAKSGESFNIAFTKPLQPGRYVLLCYSQDPGAINGGRPAAEGIVTTFTVK